MCLLVSEEVAKIRNSVFAVSYQLCFGLSSVEFFSVNV